MLSFEFQIGPRHGPLKRLRVALQEHNIVLAQQFVARRSVVLVPPRIMPVTVTSPSDLWTLRSPVWPMSPDPAAMRASVMYPLMSRA